MNTPSARRVTRQVKIGAVCLGSTAPIVVQAMTNTDTADAQATATQVESLARAGAELVRITVNGHEAAAQVANIRELLDRRGINVPGPDTVDKYIDTALAGRDAGSVIPFTLVRRDTGQVVGSTRTQSSTSKA